MLWPGLKKLGKELQFKKTEAEAVGIFGNSLVKMYDGQNMKVLEMFFPEMNEHDKEFIENRLVSGKIKRHEWLESGVKIIFAEYFRPYPAAKIKAVLTDIADYFLSAYPDQKPKCQKCGLVKDLDAYRIDTQTMFICEECLRAAENEISEMNIETRNAPANYSSGFLGSMLYSIPGILVTVLFFVFLETLAAVSSLLYVFLGIKGYKKFKGKISRTGAILIIVSAMIMIGLGIIVSYAVFLFKEAGTVDFELLGYFFNMPEVKQEITQNIIMSYVISGVYLAFQLGQMMKDWKAEKGIAKASEI